MFAQSSWLGPRNVQAGNAGAKLQYIVGLRMEGAEGGMQVQEIRGHTVTAVYDATMMNVLCAVTNWSMVNDACWRGCDNGAVSHRVVPTYCVPAQRGAHDLHQLPASRQASKGRQEGLGETTAASF